MKLGVLTSVETRHRYFARRLCAAFDVRAVGYEQVDYAPAKVAADDLSEAEVQVVADHFAERSRQEIVFFGTDCDPVRATTRCAVRRLRPGELNTAETLGFFEEAGVDALAVFGTNLIRAPLLGLWPGRMLNLHLGLSPYYRGTGTNFYPLLNDEPEYVGATVHLLNHGIDSGPIVAHARPDIVADDRPHTIGCKAILAGIERMIRALHELDLGRRSPVPQWTVPNPRLYLRRDYHPRQVVELYRKLDDGLIRRYVQRAPRVAPLVRLVE